ncbi:ABC transporter permease [Oceanobacillus neutriphilus]|uniref:Peptide transporter n=1 Tax=Oceanobacillus neutriphilus TaxID=531815 RepID=A0ABQ2NPT4_9BACI|nr:ABC transporter permease [Oceanobacillus neutriphilus]GGP06841.1 peptide transporter [Oceanobacillus neutriphilus]
MANYIQKRIITGILIIVVSIVLNFTLIKLSPGDPIRVLSGQDSPSPQMQAELTAKYGLDQSVFMQFINYVGNLAKGDLGVSILSNQPVLKMIMERIGPTLLLALTTAIIALIIGTALGIYCARYRGSRFDNIVSGSSYIFDSMPNFWLGMMLIMIFSSSLGWLPTSGMVDLRTNYTGFNYYLDVFKHWLLPATTIVLVTVPYYFRIARSSIIQVMSEDFITTLRATGMSESRIFNKYVFKNAILPTITVFGINLAYIVTGVAIVEIVFSWPGMGSFMLDAIHRRDYPLLMGIYLLLSISVAIMMIIVDVIYAYLDPRILYKER